VKTIFNTYVDASAVEEHKQA